MKQLLFVILLVFLVPSVKAQDYVMDAAGFVLVEGLVVLNATLASKDPKAYGTAMVILSPLGASNKVTTATNWVGMSGFAALGVYNARELSKERYSEKDVFLSNFYGLNALGAIVYITEELTGQSYGTEYLAMTLSDKEFSVSLTYDF